MRDIQVGPESRDDIDDGVKGSEASCGDESGSDRFEKEVHVTRVEESLEVRSGAISYAASQDPSQGHVKESVPRIPPLTDLNGPP